METQIHSIAPTFSEAIASALTRIIKNTSGPSSEQDASLAIPLRARAGELHTLAEALITDLLGELADGAKIATVQVDGFMQRDGEYICWGYAFAAAAREIPDSSFSFADLVVAEEQGRVEISLTLLRSADERESPAAT